MVHKEIHKYWIRGGRGIEAKSAGIDWRMQAAEERAILMLGFGFLRLEGYEKTLENMLISRSFCPDAVRELELFSFSISSDRYALYTNH